MMKTNNIWRFATIFFLSSAVFLTMVSCSQKANHSEESCPQEDMVVAKKIVYLPDSLEIKSQDELLDLNTPIGCPPTTSLVIINGKIGRDFSSNERLENDTIKEIIKIFKKRNFIVDDIKILKDDKSLAKYRQGGFVKSGEEKWLEIVYEIKAHPIDEKGEIFEVTAQLPFFDGGYKALEVFVEKNIHRPEKMLETGIHGKVVVYFIIEKDGSIEEFGIANNLLKDKSGNPCTDSAIKKLCEQEALRIVKMMPRWEPGKNAKGEPVRVHLYFPILFFEKMPLLIEREK